MVPYTYSRKLFSDTFSLHRPAEGGEFGDEGGEQKSKREREGFEEAGLLRQTSLACLHAV